MELSLENDINSISHVKANLNQILFQLKKNGRTMVITQNGKSAGVLLDIETWESILKKINLFKMVAEGEESLKKGEQVSLQGLKSKLSKKYGI